jgi:hypothetical protein
MCETTEKKLRPFFSVVRQSYCEGGAGGLVGQLTFYPTKVSVASVTNIQKKESRFLEHFCNGVVSQ